MHERVLSIFKMTGRSPRNSLSIWVFAGTFRSHTRKRPTDSAGLDPTKPNPGADGFPGAFVMLGDGPGRTGATSFTNTYYGEVGPRAWVCLRGE